MKSNTKIVVKDYGDMIAKILDMELITYKQVGSYQGDYFAVLKDKEDIVIYRGYYGSCTGCDWLEAEAVYDYESNVQEVEYKDALEYVKGMTEKARLPITAFNELSKDGKTSLLLEKDDYYADEIKEIVIDPLSQ